MDTGILLEPVVTPVQMAGLKVTRDRLLLAIRQQIPGIAPLTIELATA